MRRKIKSLRGIRRNEFVPLAGVGSLGLGTMTVTFSSATALLRTSGTLKIKTFRHFKKNKAIPQSSIQKALQFYHVNTDSEEF